MKNGEAISANRTIAFKTTSFPSQDFPLAARFRGGKIRCAFSTFSSFPIDDQSRYSRDLVQDKPDAITTSATVRAEVCFKAHRGDSSLESARERISFK
jgi:hypothetical protein